MQTQTNLTILAIDTSCDETSVAVVRGTTILSNVLPSQMEYHKKYGGVVPSLAKLAHSERIDNVVKESLKKAQIKIEDVDVIAVTIGPGLAMALEIGIKKAKELAIEYKKPLMTINHMEGHLLSCFASQKKLRSNPSVLADFSSLNGRKEDGLLPSLGFLISGNHTEFIVVKTIGSYEKIGETLDDSCGEAYDKCGRILGLGYPAGPIISEFAKRHRKNMEIKIINENQSRSVFCINKKTKAQYKLPIAMVNSGDLNFSFSGLKTAFKQKVEELLGRKLSHQDEVEGSASSLTKDQLYDLCITFEAAALSQLSIKLEKAIKQRSSIVDQKIKEVWLGGGVVASARLKSVIRNVCNKYNLVLRHPTLKKLTGDNAAMIGVVASLRIMSYGLDTKHLNHDPEKGIYLRDFEQIDRIPTLSL